MVASKIWLDHGRTREPKTRYGQPAVPPRATTLQAYPGESLASITERAYGRNTEALRAKILSANATLEGLINVPR